MTKITGIDRRLAKNFNWSLLLTALVITFIGLLSIYSANYTETGSNILSLVYVKKQLIWLIVSLFIMVVFFLFDYSLLEEYAIHIYIINFLLLLAVMIVGKKSLGAQRWLSIGGFSFQPSELFKFTTIIIVAKFFSKENEIKQYSLLELFKLIIMILIPVGLIVKQPDLGTGMLIVAVLVSMLLFVGIKYSSLIKVLGFSLISLPLCWNFLKPYQKKRILTFIFPERDPLGAGYHIIQSKIAVGSGKLFGKGFLHGTQNKLNFLPEEHTDFIFSVLAEEWGFVGCAVVIAVYFLFLLNLINIAKKAKDNFGALIVIGVMFIFLWQFFINIGMVIGILPVVGIPLPMISYGGTSLVVSYALLGLALNVSMRRYIF